MPGTRPTAWMAGSSRAATPAGLAIFSTPRSIGSGCSIAQTVTPATASPSSQGTTRQRGDGTRPSGNSNNNRAKAGRFNGPGPGGQPGQPGSGRQRPGRGHQGPHRILDRKAWMAATRPMATNSQPMAWPGRRTASTSPTTPKPGTAPGAGTSALKPSSRFSTNSTTARASSTADSAVKAQARRAAPRSPTGRPRPARRPGGCAADRLPPWLVFMPPFSVGVCLDARSALLDRTAAKHARAPSRERYGHRHQCPASIATQPQVSNQLSDGPLAPRPGLAPDARRTAERGRSGPRLVHITSGAERFTAVSNGLQRYVVRPGRGCHPAETGPRAEP